MTSIHNHKIGKTVGGALYVHKSCTNYLDIKHKSKLDFALSICDDNDWNVAKIQSSSVSLLLYEDFDSSAFPLLLSSTSISLRYKTVKHTDYRKRSNPPILHRKELLISSTDPRQPSYLAITRIAEERGLFENSTKIGTKLAWYELLEKAELQVVGNRLIDKHVEHIHVARHKTAIVRRDLSQPIQLMVGNGIITKETTIFDYGCGQGDDVSILHENGYDVSGWDPHHANSGERRFSDIVNLGFVINVIEDKHERDETLKAAWSYAKKAMAVSVMTSCRTNISNFKPYRDGHVTSIGTFQKYFNQQELREYLYNVLGEEPVPLASGIFAIFKDKDLEQDILLRRRSRIFDNINIRKSFKDREFKSPNIVNLFKLIEGETELIWKEMLRHGRSLDISEIPLSAKDSLRQKNVSILKAQTICKSNLFNQSDLQKAAEYRKEDLLVHFALGIIPGAPRYAHLSKFIQRDVRYFFGSHANALEQAKKLLFSSGDNTAILNNISDCLDKGLGALRDENTFRFSASILEKLPPLLRVLVGCAGTIRGGIDGVDFIDIKRSSRFISFITCYDSTARLPLISEITTVDLTKVRSRIDRPKGKVFYLKGKFLPSDDPTRLEQLKLDAKLISAGVVNDFAEGPLWDELKALLSSKRVQ